MAIFASFLFQQCKCSVVQDTHFICWLQMVTVARGKLYSYSYSQIKTIDTHRAGLGWGEQNVKVQKLGGITLRSYSLHPRASPVHTRTHTHTYTHMSAHTPQNPKMTKYCIYKQAKATDQGFMVSHWTECVCLLKTFQRFPPYSKSKPKSLCWFRRQDMTGSLSLYHLSDLPFLPPSLCLKHSKHIPGSGLWSLVPSPRILFLQIFTGLIKKPPWSSSTCTLHSLALLHFLQMLITIWYTIYFTCILLI